jgi:hypothetical protein
METTHRISLYNYLYLELAKTPCFSYYLLSFFFYKIGEQEFYPEVAQIMYTHVSKCKNNKKNNENYIAVFKCFVFVVGYL